MNVLTFPFTGHTIHFLTSGSVQLQVRFANIQETHLVQFLRSPLTNRRGSRERFYVPRSGHLHMRRGTILACLTLDTLSTRDRALIVLLSRTGSKPATVALKRRSIIIDSTTHSKIMLPELKTLRISYSNNTCSVFHLTFVVIHLHENRSRSNASITINDYSPVVL